MRLGDLQRFNGLFTESIKEYQNALKLQQSISNDEDHDRYTYSYILANTVINFLFDISVCV